MQVTAPSHSGKEISARERKLNPWTFKMCPQLDTVSNKSLKASAAIETSGTHLKVPVYRTNAQWQLSLLAAEYPHPFFGKPIKFQEFLIFLITMWSVLAEVLSVHGFPHTSQRSCAAQAVANEK